jgi:hypothetical protein
MKKLKLRLVVDNGPLKSQIAKDTERAIKAYCEIMLALWWIV